MPSKRAQYYNTVFVTRVFRKVAACTGHHRRAGHCTAVAVRLDKRLGTAALEAVQQVAVQQVAVPLANGQPRES